MSTERPSRLMMSLCAVVVLLLALVLLSTQAAQAFTTPPIPTVVGPVSGPGNVYPGLAATLQPGTSPQDFGYLTDEYFVSGTTSGGPYTIRILVRHPSLADRFSGTVLSECMHFSGVSVDFGTMRLSIMLRGHVHVEIAAQASNVTTLKNFNAARYGTLNVPAGSTVVSEIIAQVGTLIKSMPTAVSVPSSFRHLILMGTSQASAVLETYEQQIHFQNRMPNGKPIMDGYFATSTLSHVPMMIVDVPTIQMPTQTEVTSYAALTGGIQYRRPDSDVPSNRFRIYEVAGMSHANTRDAATYNPNPCTQPMVAGSEFPWGAMAAMGLNHLVAWVDHGRVPPRAPYIVVDYDTTNDGSLLSWMLTGTPKAACALLTLTCRFTSTGFPIQLQEHRRSFALLPARSRRYLRPL